MNNEWWRHAEEAAEIRRKKPWLFRVAESAKDKRVDEPVLPREEVARGLREALASMRAARAGQIGRTGARMLTAGDGGMSGMQKRTKYFYGGYGGFGRRYDEEMEIDPDARRERLVRAGLIGAGLAVGGLGGAMLLKPALAGRAIKAAVAAENARGAAALDELRKTHEAAGAAAAAAARRSRDAGIDASIAGDLMRRRAAKARMVAERKAMREAKAKEREARRLWRNKIKGQITPGEMRLAKRGKAIFAEKYGREPLDFSAKFSRANGRVKFLQTEKNRVRDGVPAEDGVSENAASAPVVPNETVVMNRAIASKKKDHLDVMRDAAGILAAGTLATAAIHQTGMIRRLDKTSNRISNKVAEMEGSTRAAMARMRAAGGKVRRAWRFFVPGFGVKSASPILRTVAGAGRAARAIFAEAGPGSRYVKRFAVAQQYPQQYAQQYPQQNSAQNQGSTRSKLLLGGLALGGVGLGVGLGAGKMVGAGVGKIANATEALAGAAKKTSDDVIAMRKRMETTTEVYHDIGKVYKWAKSAVGGGLYNLMHPVQTWRETKAAFKAGLAGEKTYPKVRRPAWALARGRAGRRVKEFMQYEEAGIPLTGVLRRDIYVKKKRDEDLKRAALAYAGAAGSGLTAGSLAGGLSRFARRQMRNMPYKQRALIGGGIGATAGVLGVMGARAAMQDQRDIYGERTRLAKVVEYVPTTLGLAATGGLLWNKGGVLRRAPHWGREALKRAPKGGRKKIFSAGDNRPKDGLSPYAGAAVSGGISGAVLGFVPMLRRGAKFLPTAKGALGLGAVSAGIVGGGSLIGSKIIGEPRSDESVPFTKRAALGGGLAGAVVGGAGILAAKKIPAASRWIERGAKKWRPMKWVHGANTAKAVGIGAAGGAIYGAGQGADEGQQVDSIRNMRKDIREEIKKALERGRGRRRVKMFGYWNQPRIYDVTEEIDPKTGETRIKRGHMHGRYADPFRQAFGVENYKLMPLMRDGKEIPASFAQAQYLRSFYKRGKEVNKWGQRGGGLVKDVADELTGRPRRRDASGRLKKREWEKSWFRNAVGALAGAAALGGAAYVTAKTPFGKTVIQPKLKAADNWLKEKGWYLERGWRGRRRVRMFARAGEEETLGARIRRVLKESGTRMAAIGAGAGAGIFAGGRIGVFAGRKVANAAGVQLKSGMGLSPGNVIWREAHDPLLGKVNHYGVYAGGGKVASYSPKGMKVEDMETFSGGKPVWRHKKPTGRKADDVLADAGEFQKKPYICAGRNCQDVAAWVSGRPSVPWERQDSWVIGGGVGGGVAGGVGADALYNAIDRKARERKEQLKLEAARRELSRGRRRGVKAFDWMAEMNGWDVRDPRGRSARIFAPGHQKRNRREAEWSETKEGQRKILIGAGIAGALGAGALGFGAGWGIKGWRAARNLKVVKAANEASQAKLVAEKMAQAEAARTAEWKKRSAASKMGHKRRRQRMADMAKAGNVSKIQFNEPKRA